MKNRYQRLFAGFIAVVLLITSYEPFYISASDNDIEDSVSISENITEAVGEDSGDDHFTNGEGSVSTDQSSNKDNDEAQDEYPLDYLVDESVAYTFSKNEVTLIKSYRAKVEFEYTIDEESLDSNRRYALVFAPTDRKDFFAGKTSFTEEEIDGYIINDGLGDDISHGNSSSIWRAVGLGAFFIDRDDEDYHLKADTEYTYRLARYSDTNGDDRSGRIYYLLTEPKSFRTLEGRDKPLASFGEVIWENYGYENGTVSVAVNNPEEEYYGRVDIIKKDYEEIEKAEVIAELKYGIKHTGMEADNNRRYSAYIPTDIGDLEMRITVCLGDGSEISYVTEDLPLQRRNESERSIKLNVEEKDMDLVASVSIDPYYTVDVYNILLYIREKGTTEFFYTGSRIDEMGKGSTNAAGKLSGNNEYEYYVQLKNRSQAVIANIGTSDHPESFVTKSSTVYKEEDFIDVGLFKALAKGKTSINSEDLDKIVWLGRANYSTFPNGDYTIVSLEDIPQKLPNLQSIDLTGFDIEDFSPLVGMKYLSDVNLKGNNISAVPDLSLCEWRTLDLSNNLIPEEDLQKIKLPSGIRAYNWKMRDGDNSKCTVPGTLYIDDNGDYPFIMEYPAGKVDRKYTLDITIKGKTRSYGVNGVFSDKCRFITVGDLREDFNLVAGDEYDIKYTLKDGINKTIISDNTLVRYSAMDGLYGAPDLYIGEKQKNTSVDIYLSKDKSNVDYKEICIEKDGVEFFEETSVFVQDDWLNPYQDEFVDETNGSFGSDISYRVIRVDSLSLSRKAETPIGDYDIILYAQNPDETMRWENAAHITDITVITSSWSGNADSYYFDNSREFIYLTVNGYKIDSSVIPVITDKNGTEITEFEDMRQYTSDIAIYKLRKKSNWPILTSINRNQQYNVVLKGELKDGRKRKTETLKDMEGYTDYALRPVYGFYNDKKNICEFEFRKSIADNTELIVDFYDNSDMSTLLFSGKGIVNAEGRMTIQGPASSVLPRKLYVRIMTVDELNAVQYEMRSLKRSSAFSFDDSDPIRVMNGLDSNRLAALECESPYTLDLYRLTDAWTKEMSKVVTVKSVSSKGIYYFSTEDMDGIDPDEIYRCVITGANGIAVDYGEGFFRSVYGNSGKVEVESISIAGGKNVKLGGQLQLTANILPSNASNKLVNWESSDENIATVDTNGLVSGISLGKCVITASVGKKTASIELSVIDSDGTLYVSFKNSGMFYYTGEPVCPNVEVMYNGKALTEGVDYTLKYINNKNASIGVADSKKPHVTVTGKTISGVASCTFDIYPVEIEKVTKSAVYVKKGAKASPVLYFGSYKLNKKDFENVDAGKKFDTDGSILIKGKGNFTGTTSVSVKVGTPHKITSKDVVFKPGTYTYNGKYQKINDSDISVSVEGKKLEIGKDYKVLYPENKYGIKDAGKSKISIVGINDYAGAVDKRVSIRPLVTTPNVIVSPQTNYKYGGVYPAVSVATSNESLKPNKDYKLITSNNKKVGSGAKVKIIFMGNYKGSAAVVRNFEIVATGIEKGRLISRDVVFAKKGKCLLSPYVMVGADMLTKKDYDVKFDINGKTYGEKDKLAESDLNGDVTVVNVTVTGKGNYKGLLHTQYRIIKAGNVNDLSKAKVRIINTTTNKIVKSFPYTGQEITISGEFKLIVNLDNKELVEGKDYEVRYTNNVNKGTARIIIIGTGDDEIDTNAYYGSCEMKFTITKGEISWL